MRVGGVLAGFQGFRGFRIRGHIDAKGNPVTAVVSLVFVGMAVFWFRVAADPRRLRKWRERRYGIKYDAIIVDEAKYNRRISFHAGFAGVIMVITAVMLAFFAIYAAMQPTPEQQAKMRYQMRSQMLQDMEQETHMKRIWQERHGVATDDKAPNRQP